MPVDDSADMRVQQEANVGRNGHIFVLPKKTVFPNQFYKDFMGVSHGVKEREAIYWKQCLTNALNSRSKLVVSLLQYCKV